MAIGEMHCGQLLPLSRAGASLYPRAALTDPRATPRRRRFGGGWLACLAALGGTGGCVGSFPPGWFYVTAVDRTSATVVWTGTSGGQSVCRSSDGHTASASATPDAHGLLAARVEDLRPDTLYACRILASDGRFVTWVRFRTAPEADGPFLFTVVGDSGHGGVAARAIARRIRAAHPAFLIHVGDLAYPDGTVGQLAATFFPPYRETLRRVPLFPTPGNHDLNARSGYRAVFAPLAEGPNAARLRYSFDWGPAHFVSLSSPDGAAGAPGLAAELAAVRTMPWRIVFLHEPLYTAGNKREVRNLRVTLAPILEAGGVDLVLAGHQHFYERSQPSCEYVPTARVVHVTSGGGGDVQLDTVHPHPNFARAFAAAHFLRVRVTAAWIDVRAVTPEGHTLDHFRRFRAQPGDCLAQGWPTPQLRARGHRPKRRPPAPLDPGQ